MTNKIDMSVIIKRLPETQTYRVDMMVIDSRHLESIICQTHEEIARRISEFEKKHLSVFENAIEYQKIDWREMARQNKGALNG